jgi:hypothetical protein
MIQKLGAERCFMAHHSGRYIMWTVGSSNIDARLAQGWTIHPSERNHLTRELEETIIDVEYTLVEPIQLGEGQKALGPKVEPETGQQPEQRGKRPRMKKGQHQ